METGKRRTDRPIAVMDSGVGGLSVLRALRQELPEENFLYFGDSLRAPYGTKPVEEVRRLTLAHVESFWQEGAKAVVIACNTATSAAIDTLRERYPDRILIGIEPAVKLAADRFPGGRIGVMATEMTLREEKFCRLMAQYQKKAQIVSLPCSGLVELIEQGNLDGPEVQAYLEERLKSCRELACMVLGCTHFPFVRDAIAQVLGPGTALVDGSQGTARETRRRLEEAGLLRTGGPGTVEIRNSLPESRILELSWKLLEQRENA